MESALYSVPKSFDSGNNRRKDDNITKSKKELSVALEKQ